MELKLSISINSGVVNAPVKAAVLLDLLYISTVYPTKLRT
jgi:hypothetical protein